MKTREYYFLHNKVGIGHAVTQTALKAKEKFNRYNTGNGVDVVIIGKVNRIGGKLYMYEVLAGVEVPL